MSGVVVGVMPHLSGRDDEARLALHIQRDCRKTIDDIIDIVALLALDLRQRLHLLVEPVGRRQQKHQWKQRKPCA